MNETNNKLRVFLSYAHNKTDLENARRLYQYLCEIGTEPWLAKESLLPGQVLKRETQIALEQSDVIIICLSKNSVNKEGNIQLEIKAALDKALEKPEGEIYIIPVTFDDCEPPYSLNQYQQLDLFVEKDYSKLWSALNLRASHLERSQIRPGVMPSKKELSLPESDTRIQRVMDIVLRRDGKNNNRTCAVIIMFTILVMFVIVVIPKLPAFIAAQQKTPIATQSATLKPSPTKSVTVGPSSIPTLTVTPFVCPYQGQTDDQTIINLIQAEASAVNMKDLAILLTIFSPDAVINQQDTDPVKNWKGPVDRYEDDLFVDTKFKDVQHFDIQPVVPVSASDTIAYYTSGSRGSYQKKGEDWTPFFNGSLVSPTPTQYGSDHWFLKKDEKGCWVIVRLDFNAGHVKFP
jgi:hypothetical protein